MKKLVLALGLGSAAFFSGCGVLMPTEQGLIFTANTTPVTATSAANAVAKEGTATCTNILGLVSLGNCSVNKAAASAGINQIKSVDSSNFSLLGIFSTKTTIVKGN